MLVFFSFSVQAQETVKHQEPDSLSLHSPKKASIYSAVLPGLGQVYNKKYWKVPIIYAGFGVLIYAARFNGKEYQRFRSAYFEYPDDEFQGLLSQDQIEFYVDSYRRSRDLSIIGFFALWGLNVIDANVDAHFFDFDISPDISLHIRPVLQRAGHFSNTGGIALQFCF